MSIHSQKSYMVARQKGAAAAASFETWEALMGLSKRELAEIAMHLGAMCTDSYDEALRAPGAAPALRRVMEERSSLRGNGII